MIAIDILREEMEKAHGDLNVWQEDWIVKAMERYAEQQVKNCSIPDVVGRSEQLVCDCGDSNMTWYGNDDDKQWFCFNCKKEAN